MKTSHLMSISGHYGTGLLTCLTTPFLHHILFGMHNAFSNIIVMALGLNAFMMNLGLVIDGGKSRYVLILIYFIVLIIYFI